MRLPKTAGQAADSAPGAPAGQAAQLAGSGQASRSPAVPAGQAEAGQAEAGQADTGQAGTGQAAAGPAAAKPAQAAPAKAGQAGAGQAGAGTQSTPGGTGRLRQAATHSRRLLPAAARNWLFTLLLLAGLVLRVLTQVAYRPALLYIDSVKYLYNAWPGTDPVGFKVPLKFLLLLGNLQTVAAVQHLLGLGMAVAIYAVLRRRGVPGWLAALATAPVLLDAYQLQMEQTIMPDVWFEALIVTGLTLLLWQARPALWGVVAAGLTLGAAVTIRQVGEILIVPALACLVLAAGGWRRLAVSAVALIAAFALPIVVYCSIAYATTGHFRLSRSGTSALYGRLGEAVDCASLNVPASEQALCPTARQKAEGADALDHNGDSPLALYVPPPTLSRTKGISRFNRSVLVQQPLNVASSWLGDAIKLFAVTRVTSPGDTPIWRWQFQDDYPTYGQAISLTPSHTIVVGIKDVPSGGTYKYTPLDSSMGGRATLVKPVANFLRHYQLHHGYTPGPAYLIAALAGLIGSLSLLLRRRDQAQRDLARACAVLFTAAVTVLLASDIFEFSWRYQLPALITLPPAGVLGIAVIIAEVRRRRSRPAGQDAPGQVPELTAPAR
jgi:hypothetical protein